MINIIDLKVTEGPQSYYKGSTKSSVKGNVFFYIIRLNLSKFNKNITKQPFKFTTGCDAIIFNK